MPAWLLVYVIVFDVGTSDKEIRFDIKFQDLKACQEYALGNENQMYMQKKFQGKGINLVYPGCETESRAMYLDAFI